MCDNERSKYEKLASDAILSGETSGEGDEKSTLTKKDDHKHLLVLVDGSKYGNTAFEKALRSVQLCDILTFLSLAHMCGCLYLDRDILI